MSSRTLAAPQTICRGSTPEPIETEQTFSLVASGCGVLLRTLPTTTPAARAARSSSSSTSNPAMESCSARLSTSLRKGTNSRSHCSETRINPSWKRPDPTDGREPLGYGGGLSHRLAQAAHVLPWPKTRASGLWSLSSAPNAGPTLISGLRECPGTPLRKTAATPQNGWRSRSSVLTTTR